MEGLELMRAFEGMAAVRVLDTAKAWLGDVLDALRPALDAGGPVVGLEPRCVAVFRDELCELLPDRADAVYAAERSTIW
jgi:hypothetical protein